MSASGALPWGFPTMLAPMEGVSHPLLREMIAERGGVGIVCTEFVRVSRAPISEARLRREVVKAPGLPLSVQVMGNDADKMAEAAAIVADAGADVVDVNLGCPTPRAVRGGVGAAMLKDLALLESVLSRMRARTPVKLSAKIRAGFDDAARVLEIGRVVQGCGADYLVVHPRRRCDFYEGTADWRVIARLKDALSIPVVGNGDAWFAADVPRMMRQTGCDAVMIGRPALRNPWIFRQAAELMEGREPVRPSGADLMAHLREVRRRYEPVFGGGTLGKAKELLRYLGQAVDDGGRFVREVVRLPSLDSIFEACARILPALPPDALRLEARPRAAVTACAGAR